MKPSTVVCSPIRSSHQRRQFHFHFFFILLYCVSYDCSVRIMLLCSHGCWCWVNFLFSKLSAFMQPSMLRLYNYIRIRAYTNECVFMGNVRRKKRKITRTANSSNSSSSSRRKSRSVYTCERNCMEMRCVCVRVCVYVCDIAVPDTHAHFNEKYVQRDVFWFANHYKVLRLFPFACHQTPFRWRFVCKSERDSRASQMLMFSHFSRLFPNVNAIL